MAAQKNKPAPEEPSAKRRRLDTNGKAASSIKKKIASPGKPVGYKSKLNKGLEQRKKAQKASVKPTGSINKALKNPTQTKGTSNRSKQIKLEPKQNHKPKFNQKPSKNKHVGKVLGKKTVAKSNKVLSSKTAAQTSPGSQNIVSKSSRNNVPKVTRSPSRAISAKTERTTCKTTKGSVRSRTPARLRSAVNGRKGSPDTSSPRSSVLKSVKLLTKTGLRITHLENKPAKNDSRRNTAVKGSTPVTADSLHEINARKQSKRLERDALSNDATSSTIKSSDVNRVESRTAVVRKNVRSAVDSEAHENLKPHSKPKSVNKCASGKKPAKHVPKWKRTSRLELEGRRSQRLQQHSGLTVKSQQKRDMKKKVLKVTENASVTQADWRRVKTEKHRVPKKKGQREGQASASRPSGPMTAKSKQKASKTTRKPKEIEQVLKSPPKKASKTNHKQAAGSSCPKSLLKSEGSSQQSPCEDAAETLLQLAAQESSCKQKKGKGPVLKKLKEKVVSKEEKLKAKAILKQKKMEAKAALKEQKLKEKAALKEKKLKEKVVSKEQKLKEKVARLKVKNKLKNKKSLGPQAAVIGTTCQSEMDPKSKRVSILELCEEIAGEIESDTVEVRKEVPDSACAIEATKAAEELLQQVEAESKKLTEEAMQNTPSKCFFPSKKTLHAKNRLNGKTSPIVDSKRKESRPVKASHVSRSNALNRAALPNLELLRRNILVPSKGNQARTTEVSLAPTDMDCPETRGRLLVAQLEEANQIHDSGKLEKVCLEGDWTKDALQIPGQLPVTQLATDPIPNLSPQEEMCLEEFGTEEVPLDKNGSKKRAAENELMMNKMILELEPALDESFSLRLDSSPESSPVKTIDGPSPPKQTKLDIGDWELEGPAPMEPVRHLFTDQAPENGERRVPLTNNSLAANSSVPLSEANLQKEVRKLKKAEQDGDNQLIIDAGQKRFGAMSCNVCGMLYTASNPEDETQHILFHNQFVSAVKYVGWKKERIVAEFPDGKIIMVFPDDPKYALRKVEEIREMVDYDLGFQQVPLRFHARTKTLLFISNDKKVVGCLIAEHIQWGYRVINEKMMSSKSEREKAIFESQKAWCCSTSPEPALCGISRIWVFRMMRRQKIASRMIECLRSNFIYGSYLSKEEIAFSDPTPDGKLFASQYCGTGQFLVYNFISGQPETT